MLREITKVIGLPVLSLHVGARIATVKNVLIDPDKLQIVAFFVRGNNFRGDLMLLPSDIREINLKNIVVDGEHRLVEPGELIRLKSLIEMGYEPLGKGVEEKNGRKLGVLTSYFVEIDSLFIKKIVVKPKLRIAISSPELTIDRQEI